MKERKYYIGIDLGGTFIKGGIVDGTGALLAIDKTPTEKLEGGLHVVENIVALSRKLLEKLDQNFTPPWCSARWLQIAQRFC